MQIIEINKAKFNIRPNSWDINVVKSVASGREYGIKPKKDDVVVDIGGHIGSYSIMAGLNGAKVYVFEPTKENFDVLVENIKLNGLEDNVKAFNKAVVGVDRPFKIKFNRKNTGSSIENEDGYEVDTITFDEVMEMVGDVDILKMDCEGTEHEYPIKKWADKIKTILAEIHIKKTFIDNIRDTHDVDLKPSNASRCWMLKATKK